MPTSSLRTVQLLAGIDAVTIFDLRAPVPNASLKSFKRDNVQTSKNWRAWTRQRWSLLPNCLRLPRIGFKREPSWRKNGEKGAFLYSTALLSSSPMLRKRKTPRGLAKGFTIQQLLSCRASCLCLPDHLYFSRKHLWMPHLCFLAKRITQDVEFTRAAT